MIVSVHSMALIADCCTPGNAHRERDGRSGQSNTSGIREGFGDRERQLVFAYHCSKSRRRGCNGWSEKRFFRILGR
jgi:hypothetical protein